MAQENITPGNLSAAEQASAFIAHLTDLNNALLTIWMLTQKQQPCKVTSGVASDRSPNRVV